MMFSLTVNSEKNGHPGSRHLTLNTASLSLNDMTFLLREMSPPYYMREAFTFHANFLSISENWIRRVTGV